MASTEIEALVQQLARLPGLGPRSARRAVLHLMKKRESAFVPLLAALQSGARYAGRSSVRTWLTGILKNKLVDLIRDRARYHEMDADDDEALPLECAAARPDELAEHRERVVPKSELLAQVWAGVVVDGCVRDVAELALCQTGIRALAAMPLPTEKRNEGQRDVAVQIQGVWVRPGEWLYADEDGVVVSSTALHA